jgi:CheY-like chemotaxis protein
MKLEYRILLLDDNQGFIASLDLDPLTEQVRDWGFDPIITTVTTPDEFMALAPFRDFDLIAVDFNLGDAQPRGDEFIKQVRDNSVYTEVVFYSAMEAGDLWAAISARRLEGVYLANRGNLIEKVLVVARQSVRKVLDLNNVRGMIMAEVGDLDHLLDEILRSGFVHLDVDEQKKIYKRFHEKAVEQANETLKRLDDFLKEPSVEAMIQLSDSTKRFANLNRLKKAHAKVKVVAYGDYDGDVLRPRNHLAHGRPQHVEGKHVFTFGEKEYVFDDAESVTLRRKILTYRAIFAAIQASVADIGKA